MSGFRFVIRSLRGIWCSRELKVRTHYYYTVTQINSGNDAFNRLCGNVNVLMYVEH